MNLLSATIIVSKTFGYKVISPKGESTTIILLNGHSIKPTPNDLSLCS